MKHLIPIFVFLALSLSACTGKDFLSWNVPGVEEEGVSHDMIILGERLPDPYSVENMTKALNAIHPSGAGRTTLDPTDFYVRFLPKDDAQMQILADAGLQLLDHPLDYRILREGDWYHDPSLPEGSITWQYGVVPVDFEFPPSVRYERLDNCYLPDNDPATKADGIDWAAVEREAYRLTGNGDMLLPDSRAEGDAGKYYMPEGRIAVMDPDFSAEPVGVKGVTVCCNSFVKIATAYTDEQGYYHLKKSYNTDIRYRLIFKNVKGFCQGLNLILLPASVSTFGKQPPTGFSVVIDNYSEDKLFARCVVNNAGYDYVRASEKSAGAIAPAPRDLRLWVLGLLDFRLNIMMHQGVIIETWEPLSSGLGEYLFMAKIVQPDVYLGVNGCSSYNEIYERALLAFAQAGHFSRVGKDWWHHYVVYTLKSLAGSSLANPYGERGDEDSPYCELVQCYSCYCQSVLYRRHYPDSEALFGSGEWFSPQLLMYLDERGLGLEKISPLFTTDVVDMEILKLKMLSYYPEFKSVINEAFARYGEQ